MRLILGLLLFSIVILPARAQILPDGSLVIALPPCQSGYVTTGPYCVLGTAPSPVAIVVTVAKPAPLAHGALTLTGKVVPSTPGTTVRVDWYNQSSTTAPPSSEPIVTCVTDSTGTTFSCAREVVDNPGELGYMWYQVNGGPWQVAWSGIPL